MTTIYDILEKVKDSVSQNGITNKITFGDILDVDLDKTTMFPLAHIVLGTTTFNEHTINIPLNILFLDIVDITKESTDEDIFYGNANLQDVLNTQFQAANMIQSELRRGDLFQDLFQLIDNANAEPFLDNFENQLAGWSLNVNIEVPNKDLSVC